MKLMTAEEALMMTNTAGERLLRINNQLDNIQKSIKEESLKGNRQVLLASQPLDEVIAHIQQCGYDYEQWCNNIYIRW